ncbi:FAD-binding protein [Microbispora hainanensis]|uniref:FAD-binding protein n=1 Tax=Microbispora hainanensis TaxID=568844 RepID=A0A544YYJ2_9ACTN|nr:FAD-binding protein [Microbispora hainanensis]TQS21775.1 FAD-binding protein [Microbispora hainanensis]
MTAWDEEFDQVIVGTGGGGMAAALTAYDSGLSCVVVEKSGRFGGSAGISAAGSVSPTTRPARRT